MWQHLPQKTNSWSQLGDLKKLKWKICDKIFPFQKLDHLLVICHQENIGFHPYSQNITQFFIFVLSYIVYTLIWLNLLANG